MNKEKIFTIGALVIAVLVLGVIGFTFRKPVVNIEQPLGAMPGPDITSSYLCIGGICSYSSVGTCANATTTLFSIKNPANATSTIDFFSIRGTNGTTTIDMVVGTTTKTTVTTVSAATDVSASLVNASTIATSTGIYLVNGQLGSGSESATAGTGSLGKIVVAPGLYVAGYATSSYANGNIGGIIGGNNTFSCTYEIRWVK